MCVPRWSGAAFDVWAVAKVRYNRVSMRIWDLGGEVSLRVIWERYLGSADAIVFVINAAAQGRLEEAAEELRKCLIRADCKGTPLLVVANRAETPDALRAVEAAIQTPELTRRKYTLIPADLFSG